MLGIATEEALVRACEQRLGVEVEVASTFHLRHLTCAGARLKPRKPERVVLALTATEIWLLEFHYWAIGFRIGAVLGHLPRPSAVARWRRRWWAWPTVWRLELSWPAAATYIEGALVSCNDTDKLMGLLVADEFERSLKRSPAGSPGTS